MQYTEIQRAKILQGMPVTVLRGDEAPHAGYAKLREWATHLFEKEWGGVVKNPEIGPVVLNAQSVRDSVAHSMNPAKAVAFASVKDVLGRGTVLARGIRSKDAQSYFIGAPVQIDGEISVVVAIVNKDANTQRMYLHSVSTKKYLLTRFNSEAQSNKVATEQDRVPPSGDSAIVDLPMSDGKMPMQDVARELHRLLTLAIQPEDNHSGKGESYGSNPAASEDRTRSDSDRAALCIKLYTAYSIMKISALFVRKHHKKSIY